MSNGGFIYDTDGNVLHAHGGCMIKHGDFWYWYGEDRRGDRYVSCYRSNDLRRWEFRRHVLTMGSECRPLHPGDTASLSENGRRINIERPKVLFCGKTGKFVMWAHYENGRDYREAAACIATCDKPDGDFIYHGHFRPFGHMSRDCTLFRDTDGASYFISASRDNADLHVYRLTDDLMNVESLVRVLFAGEYREAPAVFRRGQRYYMLTSACTGWEPNQGCFSESTGVGEEWSRLRNFGDKTTFHSQSAFVLPVGDDLYYFGDRWGGYPMSHPFDYSKSGYVILKLRFNDAGDPFIVWNDEFELPTV